MKNSFSLKSKVLFFTLLAVIFSGCSAKNAEITDKSITSELINSLKEQRIESLYYSKYPPNVKELMIKPGIIKDLVQAYKKGGDDLFRFNIIVILNHRGRVSSMEKTRIIDCLGMAINDSSPWVRTEGVWGLGFFASKDSIPEIIDLLDDNNENVVNEAILSLARITGMKNLPFSNQGMSKRERRNYIMFWKNWWSEQQN